MVAETTRGRYDARQAVIYAALSYEAARIGSELHPEDPNGDAGIELAEEILDQAIEAFHGG